MSKYIEKFVLPNQTIEENLIVNRMAENGGIYGYIDNIYIRATFSPILV